MKKAGTHAPCAAGILSVRRRLGTKCGGLRECRGFGGGFSGSRHLSSSRRARAPEGICWICLGPAALGLARVRSDGRTRRRGAVGAQWMDSCLRLWPPTDARARPRKASHPPLALLDKGRPGKRHKRKMHANAFFARPVPLRSPPLHPPPLPIGCFPNARHGRSSGLIIMSASGGASGEGGDAADDAALDALLEEALDDFDVPPTPSHTSNAATKSAASHKSAAAVSDDVSDADAMWPLPTPSAASLAAPAATSSTAATAAAGSTREDELARLLIEELQIGGSKEDNVPAVAAAAASAAAAAAAIDLSESDGAPPGDDDMEKTLRALAASAEALADDGKSSSSNQSDEEAMLALLRQLGSGMDGGGGGGGSTDDAEAGMINLLQKLSAELPAELAGLGAGIEGVPSTATAAAAPSGGGGSGGGSSGSGGSGSTASGKAKSSAGSAGSAAASGASGSGGGPDEDAAMEGLLDNLVGQLLSKDVMHEPMKHLHEEFPVRTRIAARKGQRRPRAGLAQASYRGPLHSLRPSALLRGGLRIPAIYSLLALSPSLVARRCSLSHPCSSARRGTSSSTAPLSARRTRRATSSSSSWSPRSSPPTMRCRATRTRWPPSCRECRRAARRRRRLRARWRMASAA